MFKPFFEEDADELDNRGTVILHELAHVIGLNSEKELNGIKSAESLRNFILLVTKKVSKEALLESIKNAPPKLKLATSVLAYSPDQPRDPKATPTGGQWSSDDNNSSNQNRKSEDDSKTSKSNKESQSDEIKEESPLSENRKTNINLNINNKLNNLVNTTVAVDVNDFYGKLNFNPNGKDEEVIGRNYAIMETIRNGDFSVAYNFLKKSYYSNFDENEMKKFAKTDLPSISKISNISDEAYKVTFQVFPNVEKAWNNYADAFRYAYFSYRLTEEIGNKSLRLLRRCWFIYQSSNWS